MWHDDLQIHFSDRFARDMGLILIWCFITAALCQTRLRLVIKNMLVEMHKEAVYTKTHLSVLESILNYKSLFHPMWDYFVKFGFVNYAVIMKVKN